MRRHRQERKGADVATVTPNRDGMRGGARPPERRRVVQLILGLVLYALCQLAVTVAAVLVFAATSSGEASATVGEVLAGDGPAPVIGFAVGAVVAIIGFLLIVRLVSRRPPRELMGPRAAPEIGWGLLIGFGIVALSMGILGVLGVYQPHGISLTSGILTGLMVGVGPAVVEEVFFRGFLLRLLDGWLGSWPALLITSVVFALVHSLSSPAGPIAAVFVFLSASLILNLAYLLTRRLWLPIALHLAFNATQSAVFGLNVSGNESGDSLITGQLTGPDLLTGGALGGEGSVVLVAVALLTGIAMAVIAVRRGAMLPAERALVR